MVLLISASGNQYRTEYTIIGSTDTPSFSSLIYITKIVAQIGPIRFLLQSIWGIENIIKKLPVKDPLKVDGELDHNSINEMVHILNVDAVILPNTLGEGQPKHTNLIMKPMIYATLSGIPHETPAEPVVLAAITDVAKTMKC